MKQTTYTLNERLDQSLNAILHEPGKDRPDVGYKALERKVNVFIEADLLTTPIKGVEYLIQRMYSGMVSIDDLKKLAEREDIIAISSKPVHQPK